MKKTKTKYKPQKPIVTKVSDNKQTYVPKAVQEVMELQPGEQLEWILTDHRVEVKKVKSKKQQLDDLCGISPGVYAKHGGIDTIINQLRDEWDED